MYYGGQGIKRGDRNTFVGWSATPGVEAGGGGTPDFKWQGSMIEIFLGGLKFSISGFLGEVKFDKYFSG